MQNRRLTRLRYTIGGVGMMSVGETRIGHEAIKLNMIACFEIYSGSLIIPLNIRTTFSLVIGDI
jgi:hypothetical protein